MMQKKEIIWREILFKAVHDEEYQGTQKELAELLGVSLSTVFNAFRAPRAAGALKAHGRGFSVDDAEKLLSMWATHRKFTRDVAWSARVEKNVLEIEGLMPPGAIFGCYSAYARKYKSAPADYDTVYVYADRKTVEEIQKRFSFSSRGRPNLVVLEADPRLSLFGNTTPDVQTYADIWNLTDWYAKDFLLALKEKLFGNKT